MLFAMLFTIPFPEAEAAAAGGTAARIVNGGLLAGRLVGGGRLVP